MLLKLRLWVWKKFVLDKCTFICRFNNFKVRKKLKEIYSQEFKDKDEEFINNLITAVVSELNVYETDTNLSNFKNRNSADFNRAVHVASLDDSIKKLISLNLRLRAKLYSFDEGRSSSFMEKAKALEPNAKLPPYQEIKEIYKKLRKELRELVEIEEIEQQPKIDFPMDKLAVIFCIASILFLCTGVLYNEIFLRKFGIQVSNYFTLSDYVASSVDHIYNIIIGLLIALALIIVTRKIEGENIEETRKQFKFIYYANELLPYFIIAALVLCTIRTFYENDPVRHYILLALILAIFVDYSPKYFLKYFNNPHIVGLVCYFVLIFLGWTIATALYKAENLKNTAKLVDREYEIIFDGTMDFNPTNMVILTATSNYYFFYDVKERKTYVVSRQKIVRVDYKLKK